MTNSADASYELERIKDAIRRARDSDAEIPVWLPILGPLLAVIGLIAFLLSFLFFMIGTIQPIGTTGPAVPPEAAPAFILVILSGLSIMMLAGFLGALITIYLVYVWLKRINEHFHRVRELYRNTAAYLDKLGYSDESRRMNDLLRDLEYRMGGEKSPVLWAILVFLIGILIWYVLYVVTDSLKKLGRGETDMTDIVNNMARQYNLGGFTYDVRSLERVPDRNVVLYIVLSIVTLGIFQIYWMYAVTVDLNKHFRDHKEVEREFIQILENMKPKE